MNEREGENKKEKAKTRNKQTKMERRKET